MKRRMTRTYAALQSSTFSIFSGTLLLCIFLPGSIGEVQRAPISALVSIVLPGVFSSAIAYVAWSEAFARADKASQVSNYMFITPFLTSMLGFLLAGEVPSLATCVGGIVIALGALLFNLPEKAVIRQENAQTSVE